MSEEILTETIMYQSGEPIVTRIINEPQRVKVKTVVLDGGFTVTVDPDAMDDWEFMELLQEDKFAAAMNRLLGESQMGKLKDHLRDPQSGRVRVTVMSEALKTIMEKAAPNS